MVGKKRITEKSVLERILTLMEKSAKSGNAIQHLRIYDNKGIMELLNIKDKYLKKLRDEGYLGYSRCGDKYWYTQEDVETFMKYFHFAPFAVANNLHE